ncbi:RNA methyltransferase [Crocinitomicaceae bacterium]|nr:RNA methyltransferase [Crocinitomicaceae bacterium]
MNFVETNLIKAFLEHLSKNKIKWIRSLRLKKNRDSEAVFVVEGEKMVREILKTWTKHIALFCTSNEAFNEREDAFFIDKSTMKELSSLHTPSDFLVVMRQPKLETKAAKVTLAIDGIQDPGNMGTIIRTADWFGVDEIVCAKETVDIFNPKVIQSSMGSLFRIPVSYVDLHEYLSKASCPIYGALLEGEDIYEKKLNAPCIFLIGNEGNGISKTLRPLIGEPVLIPGKGAAESLNAAVATGIVLSEFSRSNSMHT